MTIIDWISTILATVGSLFVLTGGIGALRMPDLYTRMHAASLTDTLGSLLILTALILQSGLTLASLKILAIAFFLLFTSPVASYALGNAALLSGHKPQVRNPEVLDKQ